MRVVTVLGPSGSGKTSLVQALAGLEAHSGRAMALQGISQLRSFTFMGEDWAAIDIAGGSENHGPVGAALAASDIAVVVVPADADAAVLAAPYLRMVEEAGLPCIVFINRVDAPQSRISEVVLALQTWSRHHIVLREVPIREGDAIVGFVDLVSERAWKFQEGGHSVLIEMPDSARAREAEARAELLESYADFDDRLMEELIEDQKPTAEEVYDIAARTLKQHALVACFMGSAAKGHGITRLMKSLRHDAPGVEEARDRLAAASGGAAVLAVGALGDTIKHLGKVVVVRALGGPIAAGQVLAGAGIGALTDLDAKTAIGPLAPGQIGLAVKSDHLAAGRAFSATDSLPLPPWADIHAASYRRIVTPVHEKDDTRLLTALDRMVEIDPGLRVSADEASGHPVLATLGPLHLRRVLGRIEAEFTIPTAEALVPPALRETIAGPADIHHRHRKQSGGAGQFADVHVTVAPAPRGAGFAFGESVKGGAVPRNYIPSVEAGAREALAAGPMGFPVVDLRVELKDGKSHAVDSSDHAFRTAGAAALREALAEAGTVLLQPIMAIEIHVPQVFSGALVPLATALKGQVQGFEAHERAAGWDVFRLTLPMASEDALFAGLAGATRGTAWFVSRFDHYQEARREDLGDWAKK